MGEAIELTSHLYPGLLEERPNLHFMLKCRQFIEMVNGNDTADYQSNRHIGHTSVIQSTKPFRFALFFLHFILIDLTVLLKIIFISSCVMWVAPQNLFVARAI